MDHFINAEMYKAKLYKLTFKEFKLDYPEITNTINELIYSNFSIDNN